MYYESLLLSRIKFLCEKLGIFEAIIYFILFSSERCKAAIFEKCRKVTTVIGRFSTGTPLNFLSLSHYQPCHYQEIRVDGTTLGIIQSITNDIYTVNTINGDEIAVQRSLQNLPHSDFLNHVYTLYVPHITGTMLMQSLLGCEISIPFQAGIFNGVVIEMYFLDGIPLYTVFYAASTVNGRFFEDDVEDLTMEELAPYISWIDDSNTIYIPNHR
jgi:hypothetical protein